MKIIIFSSLPPPIGGVTKSVENLLSALKTKSVETSIVSTYYSFKPLFGRYDIAHIHYTKSWKRLLAILLGKLIAKKIIYTLHGNRYNTENKLNDICEKLVDGAILLNKDAENRYNNNFKSTVVLGSIFLEGTIKNNLINKNYIKRIEKKIYLLVYAFDKTYRNSKEVYGVNFVLENIDDLDDKYILVILDIKGAYRDDIKKVESDSLVYVDYEVDFLSLLSEIDIYVRPTTTDGSSVAVQEALMLGKKVLASDVVERPAEVTLYKAGDFDDFKNKLEHIKNSKEFTPNSIDDYLAFCNRLLENK